jgi:hypothetical protein
LPCCVSFRKPGVVGGLRGQYPGLGREFCHLCHLSVLIVFIRHDSMSSFVFCCLHHSFVVLQHSPSSAVEPAMDCAFHTDRLHCRVVLVFVQVWWLTLVAVIGVIVCLPCIAARSLSSSLANHLLALRYIFGSVPLEAESHSWQICHDCFRRWHVGWPAPGEALRRRLNCTTRCSH